MEKVKLHIAGENYSLSTDENPDVLIDLAENLDNSISSALQANKSLSLTQATVLTALDYADKMKKTEYNCEILRNQISEYINETAKARSELELSKRENEKLKAQIKLLKDKK